MVRRRCVSHCRSPSNASRTYALISTTSCAVKCGNRCCTHDVTASIPARTVLTLCAFHQFACELAPWARWLWGSFCRARRQTGCPFVTHNVTSRTSIAALRKVHSINALLAIRRAYSGVLIIRFHTLIVVSGGMRFRCSRVGVRNKVAESKSKNPSRRCHRGRETPACGSIQAARVPAKIAAAPPVWRARSPRLAVP